ncbi:MULTISPECIES: chemotaxis protein CheB [Hymenobacter]|uniref:protein-glutamate methylesterase n=1 Tax=Hymenobacter jejuensis TaxID=2502781 RepID=A0A5B8A4J9_9BACT|nr:MULTISPECIES: chemotaxis protein CheB [Hymenobacter]MBC6989534.1 chemotaxis protein CheB [Hymenobacter sp. BT491]QDA61555.1 chemotaxis protein CheB [Hymenobacter jejuensis]
MDNRQHLIVIGASAGGMPALCCLVEQLPADLPAAVLVVQHFAPDSSGEHLVQRLARHTKLRCILPHDGEPIEAGCLYLAPPDRHLLVKEQHLLVTKGPRENHFRPSADALFRSASVYYNTSVIGIVLTGMLHDGTAGLEFIKRSGGRAVVQDPMEAEFPSMPESALHNVPIDYVVPLSEMGHLLQRLVQMPILNGRTIPEDIKLEAAIAERVVGTTQDVSKIGKLMPMTCPDCGGTLWEIKQGKVLRYRCHTGHAFTADSLYKLTQESLEESLWVALRMMEERKNLLISMASRGEGPYAVQQEERIEEIKVHINRLREFLLSSTPPPRTSHEHGSQVAAAPDNQ